MGNNCSFSVSKYILKLSIAVLVLVLVTFGLWVWSEALKSGWSR